MKQRRLFATAAMICLLVPVGEALACGDKFLIVGRGARFQRGYVAVYPASVLLVDGKREGSKELLLPLRRAGHRVEVVHDSDQLRQAMKGSSYDVVLADWSSASDIRPVVSSIAPAVPFLPVLDGASKEDLETAKKLYGCPLESTKRKLNRSFLARLDEVIEAKRKSKPVNCEVK